MFQLINPLWLFAIGGISIPLIIHLWNIKKGKTLKIGSISLLGESSRQSARSLKLIDLLLLFLRCLLLIILALILAGPLWNSKINTSANKGWILIEKQNLTETYSQFKAKIDSLSNLGYEFHFFEPGFQYAKFEDALNESKSEIGSAQLLPYWSLIQLLEDKIPENTQVFLFTPNLLNRLGTERPLVNHRIQWETYTPSDSTATWIENAWFNESDSVNVTIADSSPNKTTFTTVTIDPSSNNSTFEFDIQNGKASLKFKNKKQGDSLPVTIDTATIRIAIYTDKFKNDASYLRA
ncbi:MAG: BatA domain-containing protein, partial [Bacteroidetes bacterium]|nr:BatA domain-containing protein [Bacteroidota bacterium]